MRFFIFSLENYHRLAIETSTLKMDFASVAADQTM